MLKRRIIEFCGMCIMEKGFSLRFGEEGVVEA